MTDASRFGTHTLRRGVAEDGCDNGDTREQIMRAGVWTNAGSIRKYVNNGYADDDASDDRCATQRGATSRVECVSISSDSSSSSTSSTSSSSSSS